MPGASVEDEFPGDSWEFKLNKSNWMKVWGNKLKKFKAHVLVIAVTNIEPQWQFDPCKFNSWEFKLNKSNQMKVWGNKLKKFKAHVLVIAVTNIEPQWRFDPCKFLAFHQGPLEQIKVQVKIGSCVGYYSVLLDTRYGKFFNYGIEVNSYSILVVLGIGINGTLWNKTSAVLA